MPTPRLEISYIKNCIENKKKFQQALHSTQQWLQDFIATKETSWGTPPAHRTRCQEAAKNLLAAIPSDLTRDTDYRSIFESLFQQIEQFLANPPEKLKQSFFNKDITHEPISFVADVEALTNLLQAHFLFDNISTSNGERPAAAANPVESVASMSSKEIFTVSNESTSIKIPLATLEQALTAASPVRNKYFIDSLRNLMPLAIRISSGRAARLQKLHLNTPADIVPYQQTPAVFDCLFTLFQAVQQYMEAPATSRDFTSIDEASKNLMATARELTQDDKLQHMCSVFADSCLFFTNPDQAVTTILNSRMQALLADTQENLQHHLSRIGDPDMPDKTSVYANILEKLTKILALCAEMKPSVFSLQLKNKILENFVAATQTNLAPPHKEPIIRSIFHRAFYQLQGYFIGYINSNSYTTYTDYYNKQKMVIMYKLASFMENLALTPTEWETFCKELPQLASEQEKALLAQTQWCFIELYLKMIIAEDNFSRYPAKPNLPPDYNQLSQEFSQLVLDQEPLLNRCWLASHVGEMREELLTIINKIHDKLQTQKYVKESKTVESLTAISQKITAWVTQLQATMPQLESNMTEDADEGMQLQVFKEQVTPDQPRHASQSSPRRPGQNSSA